MWDERSAERDATRWLDVEAMGLTTARVTRRQYLAIKAGTPGCDDLGIVVKVRADGRLMVTT